MTGSVSTHENRSDDHFLYLVDARTRFKIGHSGAPKRRLASLKTGSPVPLAIAKTWAAPREEAVRMECETHRILQWAHVQGEWFELTLEEAVSVLDLLHRREWEAAERLAELIDRMRAAEAAAAKARRQWHYAKRDRPQAFKEGRERGAELDKVYAAIRAEALLAGLMRRDGEGWKVSDAVLIERYRQMAA